MAGSVIVMGLALLAAITIAQPSPLEIFPEVLSFTGQASVLRDMATEVQREMNEIKVSLDKYDREPSPFLSNSAVEELSVNDLFFCDEESAVASCVAGEEMFDRLNKRHLEALAARPAEVVTQFPEPKIEDELVVVSLNDTDIVHLEEDQPSKADAADIVKGRKLGEGGFKTVHKGTYKGKAVAIGIVTTKEGGSYLTPDELSMTETEIAVCEEIRAKQLNSRDICRSFIPHIIAVHKKKTLTGKVSQYWIIMELGAGDASSVSYAGNAHQAIGAAIQMTIGLHCVHEAGYIHKDVKPLNFLLSKDSKYIWTNDFGLAAKMTNLAALQLRWGTPSYMPSETAYTSKRKYDVYALGKSFSQMHIANHITGDLVARMKSPHWGARPTPLEILDELSDIALSPLRKEVRTAENLLKTATESLTNAAAALQAKMNEVNKLRGDVAASMTLEDQIIRFRAEKELVSRELATLAASVRLAEHQKTEAQNRYDTEYAAVLAALAEVNRLREEREKIKKNIDTTEDRIRKETERHATMRKVPVDDDVGFVRFFKGTLNVMSTTEKNAELAKIRDSISSLNTALTKLKTSHAEADKLVQAAKVRHRRLSASPAIVDVGRVVKDKAAALTAVTGKMKAAEAAVTKIEGDISSAQTQIAGRERLQGALRASETALLLAQDTSVAAKKAVEQAESAKKVVADKLKEMKDRLTAKRTPDALLMTLASGSPIA